ncbi:MAG: DUF58 domain-containing protein [archaeon]
MAIQDLRLDLVPKLRKLEVEARREILSKTLEGEFSTMFKGRGIEFSGFRQYTPNDDAHFIDWSASLRAKDILIREYEPFKSFNAFILLDVSNSMLFSSQDKLKVEYAAELASALAMALLSSDIAVGFAMFTDQFVQRLHPRTGRKTIFEINKMLSNPNNYGGKFDLKRVVKLTKSFLKESSMIIIISDFLGMEEGWTKPFLLLAKSNDLIGIMVRDPRDRTLPKSGMVVAEDPYSKQKLVIDASQYKKLYKEYVEKEEAKIKNSFEKMRGGFVLLETPQDYYMPLVKLFKRKAHMLQISR